MMNYFRNFDVRFMVSKDELISQMCLLGKIRCFPSPSFFNALVPLKPDWMKWHVARRYVWESSFFDYYYFLMHLNINRTLVGKSPLNRKVGSAYRTGESCFMLISFENYVQEIDCKLDFVRKNYGVNWNTLGRDCSLISDCN